MLFIDLDGFKEINDTLGHTAGDQLLRAVGARLEAVLRRSETIGRLGGDEFVVLAEGDTNGPAPELVAERLLEVLREPFDLAGTTVAVTASIGIAIGDRSAPGELLRDADIALYQAKASGKNRHIVFAPEMHAAVLDHRQLELDLRAALDRDEFFLVYQPICSLETRAVTGVEALIRWQHPSSRCRLSRLLHPVARGDRDDRRSRPVGAAHRVRAGRDLARARIRRSTSRSTSRASNSITTRSSSTSTRRSHRPSSNRAA